MLGLSTLATAQRWGTSRTILYFRLVGWGLRKLMDVEAMAALGSNSVEKGLSPWRGTTACPLVPLSTTQPPNPPSPPFTHTDY